jgi:hypothetical protein
MSDYKPPSLAPMNMADIIDAAVRLYRRNFAVFLGIIAVVYVPMGIFTVFMSYSVAQLAQQTGDNPTSAPWELLGTVGVMYVGLILLSMIAVPISQGALSVAVSRRYLGYPASVADAYGTIGARWGPLIATVLLVGLAATVGMLFCLVPGIYLGVMWIFVTPIIAIEGRPALEALTRSWNLVGGEFWRVFGTYFLLSMLVALIGGAVSWPAYGLIFLLLGEHQAALAQAIGSGISTAVSIIVQPVAITGLVLLYYDLRVRKEGFDLQILAQAMKLEAPQMTYEAIHAAPSLPPTALPPTVGAASPLAAYVQEARQAGLTYEETQDQLRESGWPEEEIKAYLPDAWEQTNA